MEANLIHVTTHGNEDFLCQSDFHPIIFVWITWLIQNYKNFKKIQRRLTSVFTLTDWDLGYTVAFPQQMWGHQQWNFNQEENQIQIPMTVESG